MLNLGADELLTTTRSVRLRLDFERHVEREVVEDCISVAQQAPSASNSQTAHFIAVTDPAKKAALADLWRRGRSVYTSLPIAWQNYRYDDPAHAAALPAMGRSVNHLADNLERAPVLVVPCVTFRTEGTDLMFQALVWGAVLPSVWSFCLAARERGLGTCWTTIHLAYEREAAEILGIPYPEVMQVALLPVAYTQGTVFKPARRLPVDRILHWDTW
jgi:nitroreductase